MDQGDVHVQHIEGNEHTIEKNFVAINKMKVRLSDMNEKMEEMENFIEVFLEMKKKIIALLENDHFHRDILNVLTINPNQPSVGLSLNALAVIRSDLQDVASTFRDYQNGFYR